MTNQHSGEIVLEVELDLPLEPDDIERYHAYIAAGDTEYAAAAQVAQDILGALGAIVQRADATSA